MVMDVATGSPQRMAEILSLDPVGDDTFEGITHGPSKTPGLFGGHILSQALLATYRTVEARRVHALHAQFLSPGLVGPPIRYRVERARDGRSFSVRALSAVQNGRLLCRLTASFHAPEPGVEHQDDAFVPVPPPLASDVGETNWGGVQTIDLPGSGGGAGHGAQARRRFWFRVPLAQPRDVAVDDAALAYASDIMFGTTPLLRHDQAWQPGRNASLDHSIWFHRSADPAQWTYFDQYSPTAAAGRGFTRGEMRGAGGELLASIAQESLLRA